MKAGAGAPSHARIVTSAMHVVANQQDGLLFCSRYKRQCGSILILDCQQIFVVDALIFVVVTSCVTITLLASQRV